MSFRQNFYVLHAFADNKPKTVKQACQALGMEKDINCRVSYYLADYANRGMLTRTLIENTTGAGPHKIYQYSITKEGKATYKENVSTIVENLNDYIEELSRPTQQQESPVKPLSSNSSKKAIEAISSVMEENESLIQTLKGLHQQIGSVLESLEQG